MTRIRLDLSSDRSDLYSEALTRLHDVEVTTEGSPDAIIVDSPAKATEGSTPCLLDQPETHRADDLASLPAEVMPAHLWRFLPSVSAVQDSHAAGQLGAPGLLRTHHWVCEDLPVNQAAYPQVDLALWFFGSPPKHTHGLRSPLYLQIHLGFENDGMAMIDLATAHPGATDYYSMHLIGSTGAAYADDHRNSHLLFGSEGTQALLHRQNVLLGTQNMLREFLAGTREGRSWSVTLQDSINAMNTIKEATNV